MLLCPSRSAVGPQALPFFPRFAATHFPGVRHCLVESLSQTNPSWQPTVVPSEFTQMSPGALNSQERKAARGAVRGESVAGGARAWHGRKKRMLAAHGWRTRSTCSAPDALHPSL